MTAHLIAPKDYEVICNWWVKRSFPILPLTILPQIGYIVDGLAAGYIYDTDSGSATIEWLVSNPDSDKQERDRALNVVLDSLVAYAKAKGKTFLFTYSNHQKLIDRYQAHGFTIADTNMTHLGRGI